MKLVTQDGRTLEVKNSPECYVAVQFDFAGKTYSAVNVADFVPDKKWGRKPLFREDMGLFENSRAWKVADAFWEAWKQGAEKFVIPEMNDEEKSAVDEYERMNRTIEERGLIVATAEETVIGLGGFEKALAIRVARETDYWERRGVIIAGEYGDTFSSFKKWQALQRKVVNIKKGVRRYEGLPKLRQAVSVIGRAI